MRRVQILAIFALAFTWVMATSGCSTSESHNLYNVHTVTPGVLIRGSQPDKRALQELRNDFGVKTVVNFNDVTNASEAPLAADVGLHYLPLCDNPWVDAGDRELHLAFLKTVRDARRSGDVPVYVHCRTGSDRVGLAVAIYRIVECGWNAEGALAELRRYQPVHMSIVFARYPDILREVERNRQQWLDDLETMSDPPVQTARRDRS